MKALSYIDQFAYDAAVDLAARQPRCDNTTDQLPVLSLPSTSDTVPIWHQATGQTEQVSLAVLASLFGGGGGGGGGTLAYNADLSALGIFNYGFFGGNPTSPAATNSAAMTNMLAAMGALNGGTGGGAALINTGSYNINCGATPYYIPCQNSITGVGTTVGQAPNNIQSMFYVGNNGTLFTTNPGVVGFGGTIISNLGVCFALGNTQSTTNMFIDVSHSSDVRLHHCTFTNIPIVMQTDKRANSNGLTECTIQYNEGPSNSMPTGQGTFYAMSFNSPECYLIGPSNVLQKPPPPFSTGPTGCIAVGITQSSEHTYISNVHMSDWDVCISYCVTPPMSDYGTGVNYSHVANCEMNAWTSGIWMQTNVGGQTIFGEKYVNCTINMPDSSLSVNSGIVIDPFTVPGGSGPGLNHNIEDISFINCSVFNFGLHGLEIRGGIQIQVVGGTYSGNGLNTGGTSAGIAITGNCGYVQVTGANLNPKMYNAQSGHNQTCAFLCSGSPVSPVIIDSCFMNNYSGPPVIVTGSPVQLVITRCIGYNDQNTIISTVYPPGTGYSAQNASTLGGGAINYYGPSMVTGIGNAGGSALHISGTSYALPASAFFCFMLPNPSDNWWISAAPINWTWLGK